MELKGNNKKIFEYINIAGIAAFYAFTLIQTVFAVIWLAQNVAAGENGKKIVFHYKETGSYVVMAAVVFLLLYTLVKKVIRSRAKFYVYAPVALYIMTLPTVLSVCFNSTLFAGCISVAMLLLYFSLRYFYGVHERRLWFLIGILATLVLLSYFNRAAFWVGIIETFVFLTIQLIRNIRIRGKNIADKSWRNTLLLFCILVIIVLMPQYFAYNHINHTLYHQPAREQLAARLIVPYLDYEKSEKNEEYLLGVIKNVDYDTLHSYRNFKRIIYRYEEDKLDMDAIWDNQYRNAYYRYRNTMVKRYVRDVARGVLSPFLLESEMNSETLVTRHGYYFAEFEKNCPVLSDNYFRFSLKGLFAFTLFIAVQLFAILVIRISKIKQELKPEEGRHGRIEAVIMLFVTGFFWTAIQTLFSLEGTSYVSGIGAVIIWILFSSFIWFPGKEAVKENATEDVKKEAGEETIKKEETNEE